MKQTKLFCILLGVYLFYNTNTQEAIEIPLYDSIKTVNSKHIEYDSDGNITHIAKVVNPQIIFISA